MQEVSKIACNNNGGFVMKFRVKYGDGTLQTDWTKDYPINQSRTLDLRDYEIPAGAEVWPQVDAVLGEKENAKQHVIYNPGTENVATYRVYGTTLNVKIDLED